MTAPDLTPRNLLRRCLPHLRTASLWNLDNGELRKEGDADSLHARIKSFLAQPETPHPDTVRLAEAVEAERERIVDLLDSNHDIHVETLTRCALPQPPKEVEG
jgi:hypothetical protein